jgi:hypothetical protein
MSNGKNASGTPDVGSGTPDVGSGTPDVGSGTPNIWEEKRRRRDQGPEEAIEDLD